MLSRSKCLVMICSLGAKRGKNSVESLNTGEMPWQERKKNVQKDELLQKKKGEGVATQMVQAAGQVTQNVFVFRYGCECDFLIYCVAQLRQQFSPMAMLGDRVLLGLVMCELWSLWCLFSFLHFHWTLRLPRFSEVFVPIDTCYTPWTTSNTRRRNKGRGQSVLEYAEHCYVHCCREQLWFAQIRY